jgi:hypothetical protein
MRIESSVTSLTWIPSEAIDGMPKLPFELGVAHYDDPPPDRIESLDRLREADVFREANELSAWIEVEDGKITDYGHEGRGPSSRWRTPARRFRRRRSGVCSSPSNASASSAPATVSASRSRSSGRSRPPRRQR